MNDEMNLTIELLKQHASGVITYGVPVAAAKAVGSITFGTPVDNDTVIVNGTTLTKVAATPGANEFTNIAELEALIEAIADINSSQDGTTISIEAAATGAAGNEITLALGAENAGDMAISGATLTGGIAADTITVGTTELTYVEAGPGVGEFSSIAELEALIEAIDGLSSAVADDTIVVEKDAPGSAGDSILLSLGGLNTGTMSVSAPNLQGGVDFTLTEKFQLTSDVNPIQVDSVINITSLTAGGTVTVTPQTSLDGDTWVDRTASAALNAIGVSELHTTEPLVYWRYKIVLGGTKPIASINIKARKSN